MKTALITGASSGIGFEFAKIFARKGYKLILVSRTSTVVPGATSVINIPTDLSLSGAPEEVYQEVVRQNLSVDVLINNAGFGDNAPFSNSDLSKQLRMIELNISALTALTRLFIPEMIRRKEGAILNVASTAAFAPGPYMAVYYATKAFVVSFSEALSEELKGTGVTVTALCPGATETNFASAAGAEKTPLFNRRLPSAAKVAEVGYRAMIHGKRVAIVGLFTRIQLFFAHFIPRIILGKIVKRGQRPATS